MAEADWTELTNSAPTNEVDRGVTAGLVPPNGGGSFVYGFNSLVATPGAAGLFTNQANFAPMTKGARISGAIKRHTSGGPTSFSPMLFVGLQGPDVADLGYLLGLSDADPHHISLVKGAIEDGIGDDAGVGGVLAIGSAAISANVWKHLRLDMVVNLSGDVVLSVFENDLDTNDVTAPVWVPVPGMDTISPGSGQAFIDDALGINSGSAPFVDGRGGFAFEYADAARRGMFDQIQIARQL
jgi:hypothetical protein